MNNSNVSQSVDIFMPILTAVVSSSSMEVLDDMHYCITECQELSRRLMPFFSNNGYRSLTFSAHAIATEWAERGYLSIQWRNALQELPILSEVGCDHVTTDRAGLTFIDFYVALSKYVCSDLSSQYAVELHTLALNSVNSNLHEIQRILKEPTVLNSSLVNGVSACVNNSIEQVFSKHLLTSGTSTLLCVDDVTNNLFADVLTLSKSSIARFFSLLPVVIKNV